MDPQCLGIAEKQMELLRDRLERKRRSLAGQLADVDAALASLEANPGALGVEEIINLLAKVSR